MDRKVIVMLKCDNCGLIFTESEADSRWSQLGDSLPPGIKIVVCPDCGGERTITRRTKMSWYSDGEPFDEYDPPFCEGCTRGFTKEECDACVAMHLDAEEDEDEL